VRQALFSLSGIVWLGIVSAKFRLAEVQLSRGEVIHMADDNVQHGIDDNPDNDATKGAVAGGLGGAAVGALAGGPVGAVVGAVAGAVASGAGVAAVDQVDNDNTVTGVGDGATSDVDETIQNRTGIGHDVNTTDRTSGTM